MSTYAVFSFCLSLYVELCCFKRAYPTEVQSKYQGHNSDASIAIRANEDFGEARYSAVWVWLRTPQTALAGRPVRGEQLFFFSTNTDTLVPVFKGQAH